MYSLVHEFRNVDNRTHKNVCEKICSLLLELLWANENLFPFQEGQVCPMYGPLGRIFGEKKPK